MNKEHKLNTDPIKTMLEILTHGDTFSEDEAKTILKSIFSKSPDDMPETCKKVIDWALDTRRNQEVLDLVLRGVVALGWDENGMLMQLKTEV
jgi:hypothetical protein